MGSIEKLERLKQDIKSSKLAKALSEQLEEYSAALCQSQAFSRFGAHEFPQVCETVRIHLLRADINNLQAHITRLDAKNSKLTGWVIALAVLALVTGLAQIGVGILPYTGFLQPPAHTQGQQQLFRSTETCHEEGGLAMQPMP